MHNSVCAFETERFKCGNIKNSSLFNIWNNKKWNLFRGEVKYSDLEYCCQCEGIIQCDLKVCRLKAFVYNDDFYGKSKDCRYDL